jgi:hypothetical protein
MLQQKLRNRQPTALQGVGLVLLIALAAMAGSAFFSLLERRIGVLASVLFIAYGCAIAWFLLDWYALSYVYTATDDCLRICRAYGKRERFAADVWLNRVVAWGAPDEMKRRYPQAKALHATRAQCPYEPLALVYQNSGGLAVAVIQPDDAMRRHILDAVRQTTKK